MSKENIKFRKFKSYIQNNWCTYWLFFYVYQPYRTVIWLSWSWLLYLYLLNSYTMGMNGLPDIQYMPEAQRMQVWGLRVYISAFHYTVLLNSYNLGYKIVMLFCSRCTSKALLGYLWGHWLISLVVHWVR